MFDPSKLGDLGIGVVAIFLLYLIIRSQISQQVATNKVVQDNTKAITRLVNTLERNSLMEEGFRKDIMEQVQDTNVTVKDIQEKVTVLHGKVVAKHEV